MIEELPVIIVGAGLSGIGAAYHLQKHCPDQTFAILEAREAMGGTWDLFRYPGIRSDSDMFTLGYRWRPWPGAKAIADGPSILQYVQDSAREHAIDRTIRYQHRVEHAVWSSDSARWTVTVKREHDTIQLRAKFLYMCTGYFNYAAGYKPHFAGETEFAGQVVHPQAWPSDLSWQGKRVVVIGSGATAMTLVPAMAEQAEHVVMLQRSPTYVVSVPARDAIADALRDRLPATTAYGITRWKNIVFGSLFYNLSRSAPAFVKGALLRNVRAAVGADIDVGKHFTPRYNVWDQRVCLVPDGDLFTAMRSGRASVVTDHIEHFTRTGIRLKSGQELPADIIVSATGLELQFAGGAKLTVDGREIDPNACMSYKGCMLTDVPNMIFAFGYTNASWTLKADLTAEYACRLLRTMVKKKLASITPRRDAHVQEQPWLDFTSGYVQRGVSRFPRQGLRAPFRVYQNYFFDMLALRFGKLADGVLEFTRSKPSSAQAPHRPQPARGTRETRVTNGSAH